MGTFDQYINCTIPEMVKWLMHEKPLHFYVAYLGQFTNWPNMNDLFRLEIFMCWRDKSRFMNEREMRSALPLSVFAPLRDLHCVTICPSALPQQTRRIWRDLRCATICSIPYALCSLLQRHRIPHDFLLIFIMQFLEAGRRWRAYTPGDMFKSKLR